MSDDLAKGWCPGVLRPMLARDGYLVRLRITGGVLSAATARSIAALAAYYGNGLLDLSARANLQLRGVREADIPALIDALGDLGLVDADAAGEAARNVIASPLAGLREGFDITPIAAALDARLSSDTSLHALPAKFGFLVDDGGEPTLAGVPADIRFDRADDETGVRFWIGLGGTRDQAVPLGFCSAGELVGAAVWLARGFLSLAANCSPVPRRMADLIERLGRYQAARAFGGDGDAPRLPYSGAILNKPPAGLSAPDGIAILGLAAPFGRLDHAMLTAAADLAESAGHGDIRLTPWRCLLLPGVDALPKPEQVAGFILDPEDPLLRIAACSGMTGCERGTTPTHDDARALTDVAARLEGSGISIHVSGCEKGCAKATRTAFTLVGRDGRYDLVQNGKAATLPSKRDLDLDGVGAFILARKAPT
jgi:precorrin-3B synthase